jgi:serine protease Do
MKIFVVFLASLFLVLNTNSQAWWPFEGKEKKASHPSSEKTSASTSTPKDVSISVNETPIDRSTKFTTSFAPIVKKVAPSVVSIFSTKNVSVNDKQLSPLFGDPLFRHFFGEPFENPQDQGQSPHTFRNQSLGSGVIVSADGYIITNYHVVEGADEVRVAFSKDQKDLEAQIVGTDPKTDVAVLKVDAKNLQPITFADSDKVEVGDVVLAIGNPFGLSQTVTMGIISALGRDNINIIPDGYEDFIQTDASINPGNSGGPLVDAEGRMVGINTAIFSRSGGNQGIGFAVPVNFVRNVMEQLITKGRVVRGYIGVNIQPVTKDLADAFKLSDTSGALVGEVLSDGPAHDAGLKAGDVIVEMNGKKVPDPRQLRLWISGTAPGAKINLKVIRDGKEMNIDIVLKELPANLNNETPGSQGAPAKANSNLLEGVEIADLDSATRKQLNVPDNIAGALVKDVSSESNAYDEGLRPGDIIMEANREPVKDANTLAAILKKAETDKAVLRVWHNGARYVVVTLKKKKS